MNRWLGPAALLVLLLPMGAHASSLVGSVHDLYSGTLKGEEVKTAGDDSRVCVYCHTPHSAANGQKAMWNGTGGGKPSARFVSGGSSSSICLTCHDGSVATDSAFRVAKPGRAGAVGGMGAGDEKEADLELTASSDSTMAHPVGVTYTMSPDLVAIPPDGKFPNGVRLVDGKVECASCHNPHSATTSPFLAVSNAGSNLCYTCHVK